MLMFSSSKRALSSKVEIIVAPSQDALHGVGCGMSWGGSSLFETAATEVVVVTDQTFKATAPEVPLHAGITGDTFMARHVGG